MEAGDLVLVLRGLTQLGSYVSEWKSDENLTLNIVDDSCFHVSLVVKLGVLERLVQGRELLVAWLASVCCEVCL